MIIIEMILKITQWSQEELANKLGVSRVSVNCWLHGNDISNSSKKLISDRFKFPISFFEASLNENIEYYKIIYSVLYENLKNEIQQNEIMTDKEKINNILNKIEIDDKSIYEKEITDDDIIDGLINGYDPFTGEIFSTNHILNNKRVKQLISRIKLYDKYKSDIITYKDLNSKQKEIFSKLKKWRLNETYKRGFTGAFQVLSDKILINIASSNIISKKDLLHIKGIGPNKYELYGDEIYQILKNGD